MRYSRYRSLPGLIMLLLASALYVSAAPVLDFSSPTPANNSYTGYNWTEVNVSITEPNLDSFKFNWNGTNYSTYDDSLVLALNFNNNTAIGGNSTIERRSTPMAAGSISRT